MRPAKDTSPFLRALRHDRWAMAALAALLLFFLLLLLIPLFYQADPNATDWEAGFWTAPGGLHPLGTDDAGRDILPRFLYGGRISLLIGFSAAFISILLGLPLGMLAGYRRGLWEYWIMRLVEVLQSFPSILLVLCLVAVTGPSVWNIVLVIGGLSWAPVARLMYANTLSVSKKDYILALRALGAGEGEILRSSILPNAAAPLWAILPMRVGRAILTESSLSFLGVGLRTPEASWGNMMQKAMEIATLTQRPWMWLPPAVGIVLTVLALQLLSDGLRRAINPRKEKSVRFSKRNARGGGKAV